MNTRIREAQLSDLPAMLDIYNDAVRNLNATFDTKEQSLEERELWFHQYGGRHPLIVAETDGEVVGYCCLGPFRAKPAYAHSTELSIYIAREHRGLGIGSMLMGEIVRRARLLGYHTVIGGIAGGNTGSVRLHEKFGFQYIGCFREVGHKFEIWQDVHFYQLIFSDHDTPVPTGRGHSQYTRR